jgi:hypothetical protein
MEYHKKNGIKADLTEEEIQGAIEGSEFTGNPTRPKPGSFVMHKVFRPSDCFPVVGECWQKVSIPISVSHAFVWPFILSEMACRTLLP